MLQASMTDAADNAHQGYHFCNSSAILLFLIQLQPDSVILVQKIFLCNR